MSQFLPTFSTNRDTQRVSARGRMKDVRIIIMKKVKRRSSFNGISVMTSVISYSMYF